MILVKRREKITEIEEVRGSAVGGFNGAPMLRLPAPFVIDANIADAGTLSGVQCGHNQLLYTVGCHNIAAIAVRLFLKTLCRLQTKYFALSNQSEVFYGWKVSSG